MKITLTSTCVDDQGKALEFYVRVLGFVKKIDMVPGKRLVKTWVYGGMYSAADRYPTLLTVDFRETGPRSTEITLRQDQLLTTEDRARNTEGWRLCFYKLEALLSPKKDAESVDPASRRST